MVRPKIPGWRARVAAAVGIGAIWLHFHIGQDREKTIEFAAALLGGLAAIYALFLNVHASRVTAAARFIERWNSPRFDEYRPTWVWIIQRKTIPWTQPEDLIPVRVVLNFFEEMGISVNRQEADEGFLKDFFLTPVCDVFSAAKHWIDERRTHNSQPSLYEHYYKMATRWERQRQQELAEKKKASRNSHGSP